MQGIPTSLSTMPLNTMRSCSDICHYLLTYNHIPFPATTLSLKALNRAQSLTTLLILSKIGYNQNMPKAVVYAPTLHGGIGFVIFIPNKASRKYFKYLNT